MSDSRDGEYASFAPERLRRLGTECLAAAGMDAAAAERVAGLLVRADLRGIETHGIRWLGHYCAQLRAGRIEPRPRIEVAEDCGALALIDGGGGLGYLSSTRAMAHCIERAREAGAAFAGVRNSRHNGAASLYVLQALEAGMIGLSLTGGGVRVAPAGGREALIGTNPIAFGSPTGTEPPFVMDIATSVVAGARVTLHAEKGLPIPLGWALDPDGRPTTDAAAGEAGVLAPLGSSLETGSHKGFALGLMVETLCHVLLGMAAGPERARGAKGGGTGHFFAALRVDAFQPEAAFRERMDRNLRLLRESRPQEGVERVYTPGELEWRRERERSQSGIPLHRRTVAELNLTAGELEVEPLPTSW